MICCRPFAWKNALYLSHWLNVPPSQDKPALAKLDLEHNSLSFVYRFDTLEDELAKLRGRRARTHERSTSTLEQVRPVGPVMPTTGLFVRQPLAGTLIARWLPQHPAKHMLLAGASLREGMRATESA